MTDASVNGGKQGWLAWLLLIPVLIAAAVVGFFVFVVILGLVLVAATVLVARLWWLRRKMRNAGASQTLEGEYVVVRATAKDGGSVGNAGTVLPQRGARDKDLR
jgi:membrane protein implicated in regulation of membrane protease activity